MRRMSETHFKSPTNAPQPATDAIHFLVFRDHLPSKAFAISSRWIDRLGWGVGILTLVTVASLLYAARSYRLTRDVDPSHLRDLESQIATLQASLEAAKNASVAPIAPPPPAVPPPATDAAAPVASAPITPAIPATSLADFAQMPTRPAAELAFSLASKSLKWRGSTLNLKFKIEYTRGDGGNQQGRIVLVARGPRQISGYPRTLFETDKPIQILASRGEYFSVSRSRPVNADFGPFTARNEIDYVDVLIFDLQDQLLFFERMKPTANSSSAPAPKAAEEAAAPAEAATEAAVPAATPADPAASTPTEAQP
jgi:hypothetical protein